MKLFDLLTSNRTLALIALSLLAYIGFAPEALAQGQFVIQPGDQTPIQTNIYSGTGPFEEFLRRGGLLFVYTRNALYVASAFVFLKMCWEIIAEGKLDWEKFLKMAAGFILLGVAGFIVSRLANPTAGGFNLNQRGIVPPDVQGWGSP